MSRRLSSSEPSVGKAVVAVVAMALVALAPAKANEKGSSSGQGAVPDLGADQLRAELDKARAAKNQAGEAKARAYMEAHLLYKNCERELRPFCLRSSQMMMRNADARYKYRESREFSNIAAMEAAIAASDATAGARPDCGTASCARGASEQR